MVCLSFWIDSLQMFPTTTVIQSAWTSLWNYKPNDRCECSASSRAHCYLGSDRSSWMFKSVLSQQVNGFSFLRTRSAVYLLLVPSFFFLLPFLFSPFPFNGHVLKFTHNAQPNKLTDSCMGRGVIRWRQYQLSIQSVSRSAITASLISCLCLPTCVLSPRLHRWEKCLRHAGTWLPSPLPFLSACHIRFCSSTHIATAFRCYKGIYTASYSIYCRIEMPNAALFLVCFDVH